MKLSDTSSEYAIRRKQHLALINTLRGIGAQADLDLPRIAVIGNQSAGKSSLVEAISGISVPRDAGTCTRCPMECRLMSASTWSCQVSIRWEFGPDGSPLFEVVEEPFGGMITDSSELELRLRRAQAAVLNPGIDASKFLNCSVDELRRPSSASSGKPLAFSRNAVCVDINGPELTDLAFVDLPGIIQNADKQTVELVEDLVTSHIKGNCIILITLPMSDDIENQKAFRLAEQEDPSGMRTIGVLTKPDTLTAGATRSRQNWLEVIEGKRNPLKHGYYCTRQPDDDERTRGITSAEARSAEQKFFADNNPWAGSTQKHRFGTHNLVASLSRLLTQIIDDTLPQLQDEVTRQMLACNDGLSRLPPPITTEPATFVLSLVTAFCQDVEEHVRSGAELVQENRRSYKTFKQDIRSTAPPFLPFPCAAEAATDTSQYLLFEDECEGGDEDVPHDASQGRYIYLQDVQQHIERSLTRELPGNVPYNAKVAMILKCQQSWELDSRKCFDAVNKSFERTLSKLVHQRFGRYSSLLTRIQHLVMEAVQTKREDAWSHVKGLLTIEKGPFTQNGHYLQVTKDKYLALYKEARASKTGPEQPTAKLAKAISFSLPPPIDTPSQAPLPHPFSAFGAAPPQTASIAQAPNGAKMTKPAAPAGSPSPQPPRDQNSAAPVPFWDKSASGTQGKSSEPKVPVPDASASNSGRLFFQNLPAPAPSGPFWGKSTPATQDSDFIAKEERERLQNAILANLAALGMTGLTAADLGKLIPPDIYERELEVMAEVRAYFQVAYKRVIDYLPMYIDHWFLVAVAKALQPFLIEKLGLGAPNAAARCATFLAEDPQVVAAREELMRKKRRLDAVQSELNSFGL